MSCTPPTPVAAAPDQWARFDQVLGAPNAAAMARKLGLGESVAAEVQRAAAPGAALRTFAAARFGEERVAQQVATAAHAVGSPALAQLVPGYGSPDTSAAVAVPKQWALPRDHRYAGGGAQPLVSGAEYQYWADFRDQLLGQAMAMAPPVFAAASTSSAPPPPPARPAIVLAPVDWSSAPTSDADGMQCSVCNDNRIDCTLTPCGHAMCGQCFDGVLRAAGDAPVACPFCREAVTGRARVRL